MTFEEILPHVDHTLLAATATKGEIEKLCEEAEMYHTASVCVPSSFVKEIRERHPGLRICAVAGFPLGNMSKAAKVFESRQAVLDGADEIDIVLHIGALKDGNAEYVTDEIAAVKEAIGDHVLKVIIETCLLTEEEKILACECVTKVKIKAAGGIHTKEEMEDFLAAGCDRIGASGAVKAYLKEKGM